MKKKLFLITFLTVLLAFSVLLVACGKDDEPAPPDPTVESIAVMQNPTKTDYIVGDAFEKAGLIISAELSNNTHTVLTDSEFDLSAPDMHMEGSQAVAVTYKKDTTKTASFNINITNRAYQGGKEIRFVNNGWSSNPANGVGKEDDGAVVYTDNKSVKLVKSAIATGTPDGQARGGVFGSGCAYLDDISVGQVTFDVKAAMATDDIMVWTLMTSNSDNAMKSIRGVALWIANTSDGYYAYVNGTVNDATSYKFDDKAAVAQDIKDNGTQITVDNTQKFAINYTMDYKTVAQGGVYVYSDSKVFINGQSINDLYDHSAFFESNPVDTAKYLWLNMTSVEAVISNMDINAKYQGGEERRFVTKGGNNTDGQATIQADNKSIKLSKSNEFENSDTNDGIYESAYAYLKDAKVDNLSFDMVATMQDKDVLAWSLMTNSLNDEPVGTSGSTSLKSFALYIARVGSDYYAVVNGTTASSASMTRDKIIEWATGEDGTKIDTVGSDSKFAISFDLQKKRRGLLYRWYSQCKWHTNK